MTQTKTNTTSPKRMNKEETHMKAIMYSPDVLELKEEDMNHYRRTAVLVGALFLISTATFIISNALITGLLDIPNFLAAVADHSQLMIAATLIGLIEGIATVGIAVARYPILKCQHPSLALRYAGLGMPDHSGRSVRPPCCVLIYRRRLQSALRRRIAPRAIAAMRGWLCKPPVSDFVGAGRLGQDDANEHDARPDDLDQVQGRAEPQPG